MILEEFQGSSLIALEKRLHHVLGNARRDQHGIGDVGDGSGLLSPSQCIPKPNQKIDRPEVVQGDDQGIRCMIDAHIADQAVEDAAALFQRP